MSVLGFAGSCSFRGSGKSRRLNRFVIHPATPELVLGLIVVGWVSPEGVGLPKCTKSAPCATAGAATSSVPLSLGLEYNGGVSELSGPWKRQGRFFTVFEKVPLEHENGKKTAAENG